MGQWRASHVLRLPRGLLGPRTAAVTLCFIAWACPSSAQRSSVSLQAAQWHPMGDSSPPRKTWTTLKQNQTLRSWWRAPMVTWVPMGQRRTVMNSTTTRTITRKSHRNSSRGQKHFQRMFIHVDNASILCCKKWCAVWNHLAYCLFCVQSGFCLKRQSQSSTPASHQRVCQRRWWQMSGKALAMSCRPQRWDCHCCLTQPVYGHYISPQTPQSLLSLPACVYRVNHCHCVCVVQYYYSVRIFPGQEPSNVWVGWVTSDFHQYDTAFQQDKVRTVTVTLGDEKGKVHERLVDKLMQIFCGMTRLHITIGSFFFFMPTLQMIFCS